MRSFFILLSRVGLSLAVVVALVTTTDKSVADCRRRFVANTRRVTVVQVNTLQFSASGLTIVPFAVPVAVPVATVQVPQVFYAYTPSVVQNLRQVPVQTKDPPRPIEALSTAATVISNRCAKCHGGSSAQNKLLFSDLRKLTADKRFEILRRITSVDPTVRMPPDAPLTRTEIEILMKEITK